MNRPQQLRSIFFFLREYIEDTDFNDTELIQAAAVLVAIADGEHINGDDDYVYKTPDRVLHPRAVDEMFADGGWVLLSREPFWWGDDDGEGKLGQLKAAECLKELLTGFEVVV